MQSLRKESDGQTQPARQGFNDLQACTFTQLYHQPHNFIVRLTILYRSLSWCFNSQIYLSPGQSINHSDLTTKTHPSKPPGVFDITFHDTRGLFIQLCTGGRLDRHLATDATAAGDPWKKVDGKSSPVCRCEDHVGTTWMSFLDVLVGQNVK